MNAGSQGCVFFKEFYMLVSFLESGTVALAHSVAGR